MQGTLDLLILKALSLAPMHGWGITGRIKQLSRESFRVGQGSLYPALRRHEKRGWVTSYWLTTEHNRDARYYDPGRSTPRRDCARWCASRRSPPRASRADGVRGRASPTRPESVPATHG